MLVRGQILLGVLLATVGFAACGDSPTTVAERFEVAGTWDGGFLEGAQIPVSVQLQMDDSGVLSGIGSVGADSALIVSGRYEPPLVYLQIGPSPVVQLVGEMYQADLITGFATARLESQDDGMLRLRLR